MRVAKGENYTELEKFFEEHDECWKDDFIKEGMELTEETIIVVEHFKLIEVIEN